MQRLQSCCGHRSIPTVLVAFNDAVLLGSAMIIAHDMDTRMDLSPWLGGVFVVSEYRGVGIGSALVKRVVQEARALRVSRLYLYTPSAEKFYASLGWSLMERTRYRDLDIVIMNHELANPATTSVADVKCSGTHGT